MRETTMKDALVRYYSNPKVYVLETNKKYKKGDLISYTTKYGKEIELIIFKLVASRKDKNYYSYVREDGLNRKQILINKSEKYKTASNKSRLASNNYYEASKEGSEFLSLGEPIKVGHHSEKRHRALIERNNNRMGKCIEFDEKSKIQLEKSENIKMKLDSEIQIDTPECLDDLIEKLREAKATHARYKNHPETREHSFSLSYAKKKVNQIQKKYDVAMKLWGVDPDDDFDLAGV